MSTERITSRQNPLLQRLVRLQGSAAERRRCGELVGDGWKLLDEALHWVDVDGSSVPLAVLPSGALPKNPAEIIPIPCSGLMEFVEQGILRGEQLSAYLFEKLSPYLKVPVDAVVLGCTHYSFLQGAIRRIVGRTPEIIDGSYGIAMQLRRRLEAVDELNGSGVRGTVTFENSLDEPEILALSRALLDYEEEE